jgi:integrase
MIGKVWIVARHRRGRKKHFALRWNEPVLDSRGQPVLDREGKVQYRTVTEACKTSDRVTAQALAEKKFGELNGLAPTDAKPTDATIEELAALDAQWLANRGRAERTVYLSRLALRMFQDVVETPDRKPLKLSTITARHRKIGARSLNREISTPRASINRALKILQVTKTNPFSGIEMVRTDEKQFRVLTPDEVHKLLKACADDQELDVYVRVALESACRANEVVHIEWDRLNLEDGTGVLASSPNCRTKARNAKRIALSAGTAARLSRWRVKRKEKKYLFAEENEKPRTCYSRLARNFAHAVEKAGIAHCTLHDFRDTIGSRAAAEGVNQRVIAELLGHAPDGRTTAKYYQHVAPETIKATILKLSPTGTDDEKK